MIWAVFIGAYLLGSIPVGVLFARARGIDIRSVGSGNIGATNVMRAMGPAAGVTVFLLDVLKGLLPTLVMRGFTDRQELWFVTGAAAVVGHCLSPWLGFKGGKGIATSLGAVIGAAPIVAAGAFGVFCVFLAVTRYMSLASLVGVFTAVVLGIVLPGESRWLIPAYAVLFLFIVYRHRSNLKRLRDGTEPKFSFRKQGGDEPGGSAPMAAAVPVGPVPRAPGDAKAPPEGG